MRATLLQVSRQAFRPDWEPAFTPGLCAILHTCRASIGKFTVMRSSDMVAVTQSLLSLVNAALPLPYIPAFGACTPAHGATRYRIAALDFEVDDPAFP